MTTEIPQNNLPLSIENLQSRGWVHKRTFDRHTTYGGLHPTEMEFEMNDVWKKGGGFLKFLPEINYLTITTVDDGHNRDGPNHSVKFHGHCPTIADLIYIEKLIYRK